MKLSVVLGECFAVFCAVMLGLAAGAIWLVAILAMRQPLPWLALPVGLVLALAIRAWVHRSRNGAAALAVLATATACIYVRLLIAAVNVAGMVGYGLSETMRMAGAEMLLQLAWMGLSKQTVAWFIAGMMVAGWVARLGARKVTRARR